MGNTITLTWSQEDDDGDELEIEEEFPSKMEVCYSCKGSGVELIDGMRGHAYTAEEFADAFDDEDREAYFSRDPYSKYNQTCSTCKGKNVVPEVDEDRLTPEQKKMYESYLEFEEKQAYYDACDRAEARMERLMGC